MERKQFGKPIAAFQAIGHMLADMATKIEAARLLIRQPAAMKARGERCDIEAGRAKGIASETRQAVALRLGGVLDRFLVTRRGVEAQGASYNFV